MKIYSTSGPLKNLTSSSGVGSQIQSTFSHSLGRATKQTIREYDSQLASAQDADTANVTRTSCKAAGIATDVAKVGIAAAYIATATNRIDRAFGGFSGGTALFHSKVDVDKVASDMQKHAGMNVTAEKMTDGVFHAEKGVAADANPLSAAYGKGNAPKTIDDSVIKTTAFDSSAGHVSHLGVQISNIGKHASTFVNDSKVSELLSEKVNKANWIGKPDTLRGSTHSFGIRSTIRRNMADGAVGITMINQNNDFHELSSTVRESYKRRTKERIAKSVGSFSVKDMVNKFVPKPGTGATTGAKAAYVACVPANAVAYIAERVAKKTGIHVAEHLGNRFGKNARLTKAADIASIADMQKGVLNRSLKRIPGRSIRLLAKPLEKSEVYQGYTLGRRAAMATNTMYRYLAKPAVNLSFNAACDVVHVARYVRHVYKYFGGIGGAGKALRFYGKRAIMPGAKLLSKLPIIGRYVNMNAFNDVMMFNKSWSKVLTNSKFSKFLNEFGIKKVKFSKLTGHNPIFRGVRNAIHRRFWNLINKQLTQYSAMLLKKGSTRAATRMAARAAKAGLRSQMIGADKGARRVMKQTRKALNRTIIKSTRLGQTKFMKKIFDFHDWRHSKPIKRALKKLLNVIKDALGKLMALIASSPIAICIIAALFGVIIMFVVLQGVFSQANVLDKLYDMFTVSDEEKFADKSTTILKQIESCHDDMVSEIKTMQENYPTADVQYPEGTKENYKEIWCAVNVMSQSNISDLNDKQLKYIANEVYKNTHRVTHDEYTYYLADGTKKTASHIYVDIQYGDDLVFESMSGLFTSLSDDEATNTGDNSAIAAAATSNNEDWLNVVKSCKMQIASLKCGYSQEQYKSLTMNGQTYSVRTDCSGYVSYCLNVYGAYAGITNTDGYAAMDSLPGFTKIPVSIGRGVGWEYLQAGDIIIADGHMEIFSRYVNGRPLVYNCGSNSSINTPGETTDGNDHLYTIVFRPNAPGTGSDSATIADGGSGDANGATKGATESGGGTMHKKDDALGYDAASPEFLISAEELNKLGLSAQKDGRLVNSNMPVMCPTDKYAENYSPSDVGNEYAGKEHLTYDAEFAKNTVNGWFNKDRCEQNDKFKIPSMEDERVNDTTFLRYIFAQHGVKIPRGLNNMLNTGISKGADLSNLRGANVVWYVTRSPNGEKVVKKYGSVAKAWNVDTKMKIDTYTKTSAGGYNDVYQDVEEKKPRTFLKEGEVVPLIALDNQRLVGFVPSINASATDPNCDYDFREYKVSDLDPDWVLDIREMQGITVKPVFRANDYFEGWTDDNIIAFEYLLRDNCWDTGKKDLYDLLPEDTVEKMKAERQKSDKKDDHIVDWSWYDKNDGDFMPSNSSKINKDSKWLNQEWNDYASDEHEKQFANDICYALAKSYDQYGILPSVGYAIASVRSKSRTTPESLEHYNVFEITADSNGSSYGKYKYKKDGTVEITTTNYKEYASMREAINDFYSYVHSVGAEGGRTGSYKRSAHDTTTDSDQLERLYKANVINKDTYDRAKEFIATKANAQDGMSVGIKELDENAIERRELMENLKSLHTDTTAYAAKVDAETYPSKKQYEKLEDLVNEYTSTANELYTLIKSTDPLLYDSNANDLIEYRYKKDIGSLKDSVNAAYKKYKDAPAEKYVDHYSCEGYTIWTCHSVRKGTAAYWSTEEAWECTGKYTYRSAFTYETITKDVEKCENPTSEVCPHYAKHEKVTRRVYHPATSTTTPVCKHPNGSKCPNGGTHTSVRKYCKDGQNKTCPHGGKHKAVKQQWSEPYFLESQCKD